MPMPSKNTVTNIGHDVDLVRVAAEARISRGVKGCSFDRRPHKNTKPMTEVEVTCKLCIRGDDGVMEVFVQVPRDVLNLIHQCQPNMKTLQTSDSKPRQTPLGKSVRWERITTISSRIRHRARALRTAFNLSLGPSPEGSRSAVALELQDPQAGDRLR